MKNKKPWYKSKGVIGSVVAVLAIGVGFLGVDVSPDQQVALSNHVTEIIAAIGALVALYGRVTANSKIG